MKDGSNNDCCSTRFQVLAMTVFLHASVCVCACLHVCVFTVLVLQCILPIILLTSKQAPTCPVLTVLLSSLCIHQRDGRFP